MSKGYAKLGFRENCNICFAINSAYYRHFYGEYTLFFNIIKFPIILLILRVFLSLKEIKSRISYKSCRFTKIISAIMYIIYKDKRYLLFNRSFGGKLRSSV